MRLRLIVFSVGTMLLSAVLPIPVVAASPSASTTSDPVPAALGSELGGSARSDIDGVHGASLMSKTAAATTGSVNYVILRCQFQTLWPDIPSRTELPATQLDTTWSDPTWGLETYWSAASYGHVGLTHSIAGHDEDPGWRDMPHPNTSYGYVDGSGNSQITASFATIFNDCASVWDDTVTFDAHTYYAVLLDQRIGNGTLGVGGAWTIGNFDGVSAVQGILLGNAYPDENIWTHEMGHAFGLFHAETQDSPPNNVYDQPYDIMSNTWGNCPPAGSAWVDQTNDPRHVHTYNWGCLPGQTSAWAKTYLGWIPESRQYHSGGTHTINLERSGKPVSTTNPLIAELWASSDTYYTVESRIKTGIGTDLSSGFDENFPARISGNVVTEYVPGDPRGPVGCVVINRLSTSRPVPVLMGTDDNLDGIWDDPGTCFTPGETWTDPTGKVTVQVNSISASSFNVTLTSPIQPKGGYRPLPRTRILDTRTTLGGHKGKIGPAGTVSLHVLGVAGVPASGVQAVVLNVHVLTPSAGSAITVYPAGISRPNVVDLRTTAGQPDDGLIVAKPGTGGIVKIYNTLGTATLIVEVVGYFGTGFDTYRYQALLPSQLLVLTPTGFANEQFSTVPAHGSRNFLGASIPGIPSDARAVAVQIEEQGAAGAGHLTLFPVGASQPAVPDFAYPAGGAVTRLAFVGVGGGFMFTVANVGAHDASVSIEVVGWFGTDATDLFHAINPVHVTKKAFAGGTTSTIDLTGTTGPSGVPATGVTAVLGTISALSPASAGNVRMRADGQTTQEFWLMGELSFVGPAANSFVSAVSSSGKVSVLSSANASVDLDAVGWFGP